MKVIGIKTKSRDDGVFVLDSLTAAVRQKRVALDDVALVCRDENGKVRIEQTGDVTPEHGAKKGALVGALVGLAAPPLLGAAAVGAGFGALWGKFRDRGVDDKLMNRVGGMISEGESVVFAVGTDSAIEAVADRVREVTGGAMETFVLSEADSAIVEEAAGDISGTMDQREVYGIRPM